jgi:hypothetical protein
VPTSASAKLITRYKDKKTKSILSYRSWPVVHCVEATPIGKFFLHWIGLLDIADYSK